MGVSGSTYTEYTGHQGEPESLNSQLTSQPDIQLDETAKASSSRSSSSSSSSDDSEAEESEVPDASLPPPPPATDEAAADDFEADLDTMEANLKSNLVNTDFSGSSILRQVEETVTDDTVTEKTEKKAKESSSSSSSGSSSASFETSSDSE